MSFKVTSVRSPVGASQKRTFRGDLDMSRQLESVDRYNQTAIANCNMRDYRTTCGTLESHSKSVQALIGEIGRFHRQKAAATASADDVTSSFVFTTMSKKYLLLLSRRHATKMMQSYVTGQDHYAYCMNEVAKQRLFADDAPFRSFRSIGAVPATSTTSISTA